ncbi:MAG TPA: ribosome silencing factor [Bacillota bacterium]
MDALQRAALAAAAASEKKANDVRVLDVSSITLVTDFLVICSAGNSIQVRAIADHVEERLEAQGRQPRGIEGYKEGRWVLLDYGDVIVHVFLQEEREYYSLERLWGDAKPVDVEAVELSR